MKALVVFCLLIPVCCFADEWNKHFDVSGTPDLHVSGGNVPVNIQSGQGAGVEVQLETRGSKIGPSDVHIDSRREGNRIELHVVTPPMHHSFGGTWIKVTVTVPRSSNLSVNLENGPIAVDGLDGSVRISNQNGPINIEGVNGNVDIQTENAPVTVRARLNALDLRMENGPLSLTAERGSQIGNGWHIKAENGPISIRVPTDLRADLSLHTGNGPHSFSLPLQDQEGDHHDVHAKLNGGGPELSIRTQNGPLSIKAD